MEIMNPGLNNIAITENGTLYGITGQGQDAGLYHSHDHGQHWDKYPWLYDGDFVAINDFLITTSSKYLVTTYDSYGSGTTYLSSDYGLTWNKLGFAGGTIAMDNHGGIYLAANYQWWGYGFSRLMYSEDEATSCDTLQYEQSSSAGISRYHFDRNGVVYRFIGDTLFRSDNPSNEWSEISINKMNQSIGSFCIEPDGNFYAVAGRKIYTTNQFISSGMDNAFDQFDGSIRNLNAYPNPVHTSTEIEFILQKATRIRITIMTLSGVYFILLHSTDGVVSQKVMLN